MTQTPMPGPGWHPDPHQPGFLRYWDGLAWTSHTSPAPSPPGTTPPGRRSRSRTFWTVGAVLALAIVGISALADEEPPETASAIAVPESTSEPDVNAAETEASNEPSAAPTPETTDVPRLTGVDQGSAERLLDRSGLSLGSVRKVWSMRPSGTVLEQEIRAGAAAVLGTTVALVVARSIPSVPGTAGRLQSAAVGALKAAGYRVAVSTQTVTSGTDGAVLRQSPVGGTRVKPGGVIRLVVANVVRPVVQAPAPSSCTPGYDPCLAPASDYDCAGGSGDGPAYTGPVRVTGSDPYQLDADGDGVACTS